MTRICPKFCDYGYIYLSLIYFLLTFRLFNFQLFAIQEIRSFQEIRFS